MDKSHRGNASQFFVAGELCRRGLVAVVTMGNTPNTDILCSNVQGTKFVHIQVKTFVPGNKTVTVGRKAELDYGANFIWVLAGIPEPDTDKDFEYFIIPAKEVSKHVFEAHDKWLHETSKTGKPHQDSKVRIISLPPHTAPYAKWDIGEYKNKWSIIRDLLQDSSPVVDD